jgi:hypothetical protein
VGELSIPTDRKAGRLASESPLFDRSSRLSNAGGVIQDIWDPDERGLPQNVYSIATLAGEWT